MCFCGPNLHGYLNFTSEWDVYVKGPMVSCVRTTDTCSSFSTYVHSPQNHRCCPYLDSIAASKTLFVLVSFDEMFPSSLRFHIVNVLHFLEEWSLNLLAAKKTETYISIKQVFFLYKRTKN